MVRLPQDRVSGHLHVRNGGEGHLQGSDPGPDVLLEESVELAGLCGHPVRICNHGRRDRQSGRTAHIQSA